MTKGITPTVIRFWKHVNKQGKKVDWMESECWEYKLNWFKSDLKRPRLKASFKMGTDFGDETMEVGRASWILSGNVVPDGMVILHRCKNRFCVRPDHLYSAKKFSGHHREFVGYDGKTYKKCSICKKVYEFTDEFFGRSGGWNGKLSCKCKRCGSLSTKRSEVRSWARVLLYRMSKNKKDILCDMTEQDLLDLYDEQNGKCYWLGVDLVPSEIHRYPSKTSPDRLDRSKGYTKDNVVLTCVFANVGRNSCNINVFIDYMKQNMFVFGNGVWVNDSKWKNSYNT